MIVTKGRACQGKHRHATKDEALEHRDRLIAGGAFPARLNAYQCKHCSGWHVGHLGRRRR